MSRPTEPTRFARGDAAIVIDTRTGRVVNAGTIQSVAPMEVVFMGTSDMGSLWPFVFHRKGDRWVQDHKDQYELRRQRP